jgi:uncharacterized membrane protein
MTTLSTWKFATPEGAEQAEQVLRDLQKQHMITIIDAAVVTWPAGKKRPKTRHSHHLAGAGALTGAFWGLLFGLLFFVPFFGLALGTGIGAVAGSMRDLGIDDNFVQSVREQVTPGTSALFLLSEGAVQDRVFPALRRLHPELITTSLSAEQEAQLRAAFAEE